MWLEDMEVGCSEDRPALVMRDEMQVKEGVQAAHTAGQVYTGV